MYDNDIDDYKMRYGNSSSISGIISVLGMFILLVLFVAKVL